MPDQSLQTLMMTNKPTSAPPNIPDKLYYTIGEVSRLTNLKSHVLRYWEQEFPQLQPAKRRDRRYYKRKDLMLIFHIRELLYEKGFTIDGARKQLSTESDSEAHHQSDTQAKQTFQTLRDTISYLESVLQELES